jgi:hypothetical protein
MYEIITQDKFRELLGDHIRKNTDQALYGIDVIYPLLEKLKFEEALPLMIGYGGIIATMSVLANNIDLVLKDKLTEENDDIVYYLNEQDMPAKISKKEFEKLIKGEFPFEDEDYETGYLQKPVDTDEKMFG